MDDTSERAEPPPSVRGRGRPPSPARRRELLDLAAAMFAKDGYHGTTIRKLAERAEMNAASLYHYFSSKEDALFKICLTGVQGSVARIEAAMAKHLTMQARLNSIYLELLSDLSAHSDYRHVYFAQRVFLGKRHNDLIEQYARLVRSLLDRLFLEAKERGELHSDLTPRQARFIYVAFLRNLTQYYIEGPVRDYRNVADAMSAATIRSLRSEGSARSRS